MTTATIQRQQCIEWCVASRAFPGQTVSGDLHVVTSVGDTVLAAVVDGLGHGDEATAAARSAVAALQQHAGQSVTTLLQECHRALQRTRGVVMTLVSFNSREATLTALGIGNVETVIVRASSTARPPRESVLLRGGVVGYQIPAAAPTVLSVSPGDVVVFATDGVREDFADLVSAADPVDQLVARIAALKFRDTDDALVLACKYLGQP